MVDVARARRLAVRIRQVVAETLEREVKDPRLAMTTITDARVTPDLREATVFYTVYGDEAQRAGTKVALESARGVVRAAVGRQTGVRYTPSLTFVADVVPDTVAHIEQLLAQARAADAEVLRAAEGAAPAGEADPYKKPHVPDEPEAGDEPSAQDDVPFVGAVEDGVTSSNPVRSGGAP